VAETMIQATSMLIEPMISDFGIQLRRIIRITDSKGEK
jgi:hypothetical protein